MAVLGLCAVRALSSCSEWELLSGCGARSPHCAGFSCCGAPALARGLQQLGHAGSVFVAHGLSCSLAGGIFPDQGWNQFPLY